MRPNDSVRASDPAHSSGLHDCLARRGEGESGNARHAASCGHCHHDPEKRPPGYHGAATTRRGVLLGVAGIAVGMAGCQGFGSGDGSAPEPVTLTQSDSCEVCGMIIPNHPGPSVEIFYADHQPSGHENPARFCSTWEAFQYHFERDDRGWEYDAFYVTDYSAVDYDLTTEGGDTLISRHAGKDAFVDAEEVTFVAGSEVKGAMGRDLIAFSSADDADQFQTEYGGETVAFADVTEGTIAQLANR